MKIINASRRFYAARRESKRLDDALDALINAMNPEETWTFVDLPRADQEALYAMPVDEALKAIRSYSTQKVEK